MKHLIISANSLNFILDYKLELINYVSHSDDQITLYILLPNQDHEQYQKNSFIKLKTY